jgi:hypothetical protein
MTSSIRPLAFLLSLTLTAAAPVPLRKVGDCAFTTVRHVGARLEDGQGRAVAGSGSSVTLANGIYGVSYDDVPAVVASKPGDRVFACLVRLPRNCPPGDARGKWYTVTNLRSNDSWTLPDAQHMCGGA